MTGKHGKMGPKRKCSKLKVSIQPAGTRVEAPGQQRLSSREVQQTAANGCTHADGSLELEKIVFFQDVVGIGPDNQISPLATLFLGTDPIAYGGFNK